MAQKADPSIRIDQPIPLNEMPAAIESLPADDNLAVRVVELLLNQAIFHRASDVHLESKRDALVVKFRIDGTLLVVARVQADLQRLILTRLKVLARLVIYQRETPQDGRIEHRLGEAVHQLRVSAVPTLHGEKVVIRLAEAADRPLDLEQLGMARDTLDRARRRIAGRQGVILLTGPSSSGKTTTMYAMLLAIYNDAGESINIATLEDPVELDLGCISQTPIPHGGDLTYADGLKALLRQDPDVLMIGEVRDLETARTVVQAGLTGHLVISTIHCGRAAMVFTRLLNMEIEPFLVASSVQAAIAQRLVRKLCPECKKEAAVDAETRAKAGLDPGATLYEPAGCPACESTGYRGRTGIFELLESDAELQELVVRKAAARELNDLAERKMPRDLHGEAIRKVNEGVISLAEALRVVHGGIESIFQGEQP